MIRRNVKRKIGNHIENFTVEGKNLFEVVNEENKLSFEDVDNCGICGSDNLKLNARITPDDNFEYVEVKCKACKAALVFGRMKKQPDTFYLRRNEQKKFDWKPFDLAASDSSKNSKK